jgi:hypothetical protein
MGIVFLNRFRHLDSGIERGRGALVNDQRWETEDRKKFWSRSPVPGPISTLAKVLLFRQKSLILLTNPGLVINFQIWERSWI